MYGEEDNFENIDWDVDPIEGLIFWTGDCWVAIFKGEVNRSCRCQVDYCPWCKKRLQTAEDSHSH